MSPTNFGKCILFFVIYIGSFQFGQSQNLVQTAVNDIANSVRVYTYDSGIIDSNSDDSSPNNSNAYLGSIFLKIDGVRKSSYDTATGLITVTTDLQVDLPSTIYGYQIKNYVSDEGELIYYYDPEGILNDVNTQTTRHE